MKKRLEQNDISGMRREGTDLSNRWQAILMEIAEKTGFQPQMELLRQSQWWKSGKIGAVHVPGLIEHDGQHLNAVLKIQGTKPRTSEALMIESFASQNESNTIRPPKIYFYISWDDSKEYEALILEKVEGDPVIVNHPSTDDELNHFFDLYIEYRENCRSTPWIEKPEEYPYRKQFEGWRDAVREQVVKDKLNHPDDEELTEKGIKILEINVDASKLEFVHGHFQPGDLIPAKDGKVVVFSNLFWSWRPSFYDAVFGYHWWMLGMEHSGDLTSESLEKERSRWKEKIYNLPEIKDNPKNTHLLKLAFLERAIAALMVDRFMLDQTKASAEIITQGARGELKSLIENLS